MTVTTPDNGFRTRLRRLARGTVVLAITLGVCGLGAGSASAATTQDDEQAVVTLLVSAGSRGAVAPGVATSATVTVVNDGSSTLSDGRVLVELNRTPLSDRAALSGWLDDDDAAGDFEPLGSDETAPVGARSAGTMSIPIPAETLAEIAPGVYPLRATLTGASTGSGDEATARRASATSVLVVAPGPVAPIAVVVPITATPARGSLLTGEELAGLTAPGGDLTAQLDGVSGTSAILAIDPAIPAAIRVLGSSAPARAVQWLTRLDGLTNERFALQFGDADATVQAQAGLPALLETPTLSPFLDPRNFAARPPTTAPATPTETPTVAGVPSAAPTPTPTPSPDPGPVLPDDDDLTTVDGAAPGILWPRSDVSVDNLATFGSYLSGATTILPSSVLDTPTGGHASVGGNDVLVTDAAASDAFSRAAAESDDATRQRWLAAANAHLFLAAQEAPGAPLLVGLERNEDRTATALRDTVSAADTAGFALAALRGTPPAESGLAAAPEPTRTGSLQLLLDDENRLAAFTTVLEDPDVLLSPTRIRLLRALGAGLDDVQSREAVTTLHENNLTNLGAVAIVPSSTIQLLSANADLPFAVRNDLPWPATVRLTVSPSDPRLEVQRVTEQVVPANSSTRIRVPVEARVGSGEVNLRLALSSPAGVEVGDPQSVRVAVRAEWETIGLTLFGGLAIVLIGLGVVRTVRRKRREGAARDDDGETGGDDEEDPETVEDGADVPGEDVPVSDADGEKDE